MNTFQRAALSALLLATLGLTAAQDGSKIIESHAISLLDSIKYPADFKHFDYVNPDAPKGGDLRLASIGAFDTLNPFTLKGVAADGLGLTMSSLMVGAFDEASTSYGQLAERVRYPENRAWTEFDLRPEAKWSDGLPITPEDVIFTLNVLKTEGHPNYAQYYANVTGVKKVGPHTVRFSFDKPNKELPSILGQLPVLPKHYWEDKDFAATTLKAPVSSGPYRIAKVDPGRSITYVRDPNYWGKGLPISVGSDNFERVRFDVYLDDTVAIEALKAREYDARLESSSAMWATAYEIPALKKGELIKEIIPNARGQGMQAFFFNTRREQFTDPKVREALGYTFDFEWSNKNLFYGQYQRTTSYFSNSELASAGVPAGDELALLEPYRDQLPAALFTTPFSLPVTDGSGNNRDNLRQAAALLSEAGWQVQDGKLTNAQTGKVMELEFLLYSPSFERVIAPVVQNMQRLGVQASYQTVDPARYQNLVQDFKYDVIVATVAQSESPGNEQRYFWSSKVANTPGSSNYAGIQNPVVDALIEKIISAPDRDSLVTATHALDRVMLWNYYVIPNWYLAGTRLVYWNKFAKPDINPGYGLSFFSTWWAKPADQ